MLGNTINAVAHRFGFHVSRWRAERENLPAFVGREFMEFYYSSRHATMTTWTGCYQTYLAIRHVAEARIPGDIVECGVYKGGLSILMTEILKRHGVQDRTVWLYDTFNGMPELGEKDFDRHYMRPAADWMRNDEKVRSVARRATVVRNLENAVYPFDLFRLVEGKVEETIPGRMPDKIALLRLDTDWYESARHELEYLFPRLVPGGVLIVDDYGIWDGARKAVDEYFAANALPPPIAQDTEYAALVTVKP